MTTMLMNDATSTRVRPSSWAERGSSRVRDAWAARSFQGRWSEVDAQLAGWQQSSAGMTDEGIEPPSPRLIDALRKQLRSWSQSVAPDAVVPGGNGGIVFEWRSGALTLDLEFSNRGEATWRSFDGQRFNGLHRFTLPVL